MGSQSRSRISRCRQSARPSEQLANRSTESLLHSRQCELPFQISIFYAYTCRTCGQPDTNNLATGQLSCPILTVYSSSTDTFSRVPFLPSPLRVLDALLLGSTVNDRAVSRSSATTFEVLNLKDFFSPRLDSRFAYTE